MPTDTYPAADPVVVFPSPEQRERWRQAAAAAGQTIDAWVAEAAEQRYADELEPSGWRGSIGR